MTDTTPEVDIVTGAFSYTGKYITHRLLKMGKQVLTLTGSPAGSPGRPDPFGGQVQAIPYNFAHPEALARGLAGAGTLYCTYWVRFNYRETTYDRAVENTLTLLQAAQAAGVRRFVYVSITNPSLDSPLPYFRGKAHIEQAIEQSGISYAILRPTVIFGKEDILINNIAYLLRRFPLFAIPGQGDYCLQPIYVEDMAELAVQAGQTGENLKLDVVGPDVFTFEALVRLIAQEVGSRARIIHLSPVLILLLSRLLGALVRDVLLTPDEVQGLMANLLVSSRPSTGQTSFRSWLKENKHQLGRRYASELQRHYRS